MRSLLVLSLGPVQDFIAAARKTRDLWYGSHVLSAVALAAARTLQDAGAELVLPAPDCLTRGAAPNKIVALVDGPPATMVDQAMEAARARLGEAREDTRDRARERHIEDLFDWELLDLQLSNFLEYYAAWHPYDPSVPGSYRQARAAAEQILAGRKALRDFAPAAGRDGIPKSSLDPAHESVLVPLPRAPEARRRGTDRLARADIKVGEQLDGISLVKRMAQTRRFVSLTRVAVDPLVRRLAAEHRLDEIFRLSAQLAGSGCGLVDRLDSGELPQYAAFPFDTHLCFVDQSEDEGLEDSERDLARRLHRAFVESAQRMGQDPPTYVAVIHADGDHMGRALAALDRVEAHQAFSRAGMDFADRAEAIVTHHQGALVYCGGDDLLAFLPLDTVLRCADAVQRAFTEIFSAWSPLLDSYGTNSRSAVDTDGRPEAVREVPTLSVGVSISHYSDPLHLQLQRARDAEQYAKGLRNALTVTLQTRSGGTAGSQARYRWSTHPLDIWTQWIDWYRDDVVPDGAAYELRTLARELQALADQSAAGRVLVPEVRRILRRKKGMHGTRSLNDQEIGRIQQALEPGTSTPDQPERIIDRLEVLVATMLIARHFARVASLDSSPLEGAAHAVQ